MTIIFFGSDPWFSPQVLEALVKAGHKVSVIVTKGDKIAHRLQTADYNKKLHIIQANRQEDISLHRLGHVLRSVLETPRTDLSKQDVTPVPDTVVLAAFGPPFLSNDVLNWPKYGCLNIHASLLPRWRGASPVFAALAAGDQKAGVSIMRMTEKIDKGPVLGQKSIQILHPNALNVLRSDPGVRQGLTFSESFDTRESLTRKLGKLGGELIVETLQKIENDHIKFISQPKKSPTLYTRRLTKDSGHIDWSKSPIEIERFIRAVTPWPGAWTKYKDEGRRTKGKGRSIKILEAHLSTFKPVNLQACQPSNLSTCSPSLVFDEVQLPGKNPISWKQFLVGHPNVEFIS